MKVRPPNPNENTDIRRFHDETSLERKYQFPPPQTHTHTHTHIRTHNHTQKQNLGTFDNCEH